MKKAGQLIAFSERLKHAQKEITETGRNGEEKRRRSAKAVSAQRGFLSCQSCRGSGLQLVPCSVSAKKSLDLTAADIFDELQKAHPALMRGSNPMQFGSVQLQAGLKTPTAMYMRW